MCIYENVHVSACTNRANYGDLQLYECRMTRVGGRQGDRCVCMKHPSCCDGSYRPIADDVTVITISKICERKQKTAAILVYQEMVASMAISTNAKDTHIAF